MSGDHEISRIHCYLWEIAQRGQQTEDMWITVMVRTDDKAGRIKNLANLN
jgi:hypothetical protein